MDKNKSTYKYKFMYYNEPVVDIAVSAYDDFEHNIYYNYTKYNYIGDGLEFFGYTFESLFNVLMTILFKYCKSSLI